MKTNLPPFVRTPLENMNFKLLFLLFLTLSLALSRPKTKGRSKQRNIHRKPPSIKKTKSPTFPSPSVSPSTISPTHSPTTSPTEPTATPTVYPTTKTPTHRPSFNPTTSPTYRPTPQPSSSPTYSAPTGSPTQSPSFSPTLSEKTLDFTLVLYNPNQTILSKTQRPTLLPTMKTSLSPTSHSLRSLDAVVIPSPSFGDLESNFSAIDWLFLEAGIFCLVDFVFEAKFTSYDQMDFLFRVPSNCNNSEPLATCFPLEVTVLVTPDPGTSAESFRQTFQQLIEPLLNSTGLFTIASIFAFNDSVRNLLPQINFYINTGSKKCWDVYLNPVLRQELLTEAPTPSPTVTPTSSNTTSPPIVVTGLSGGALAGVILGCALLLCLLGIFLVLYKRHKDKIEYSSGATMPLIPLTKKDTAAVSMATSISSSTLGDSDFAIDLTKLKLGKLIGSGANGRIFAARYSGSDVAVKELLAVETPEEEDDRKDSPANVLKREFDNLRRLKHPHVIQMFGLAFARSAETGFPRYLLVMELAETSLDKVLTKKMKMIEGNQLSTHFSTTLSNSIHSEYSKTNTQTTSIPPNTPLGISSESSVHIQIQASTPTFQNLSKMHLSKENLDWALNIARQIALGLAFIHDKGVIHFDVKPHNILLDKAGTVKLCDLGISKMISHKQDLTLTNPTRAGTPSYMAPELLKSDLKAIGKPVDVYAFAIVFWQLLHLKPPHPKDWSVAQLFDAVLHESHRPPLDPEVDSRYQSLIQKCWAENSSERPAFQDVLADLDEIMKANLQVSHIAEEENNSVIQFQEAVFVVGDRVHVLSSAIGLIKGTVSGISSENGRRLYEIRSDDGSLMFSVPPVDMVPLRKSSPTGERKRPAPVQTFDVKNATVGEVAVQIAIAKAGRRKARRGSIESFMQSRSIIPQSPKSALKQHGIKRLGKRIWKSKEQGELLSVSPTSADLQSRSHLSSKSARHTQMDSNSRSSPSQSNFSNIPALTPFSLRFLNNEDTEEGTTSVGTLEQTFKYDGAVLEMKGLLVSQTGLVSTNTETTVVNTDDSSKQYAGKLFKVANLGSGASGTVHSALHEETFEIVAIKEVKFLADSSTRHQTVRELTALASLNHPNIARFLSAYLDPRSQCVCIVLEYVLGGSLQDYIDLTFQSPATPSSSNSLYQPPTINESTLKRIAHDLVSALEYCHSKLIAHLDIKPSNILLTLNGSAKLADFGLAKSFKEASNVQAATFVGTTKYMSPERLKGENYSFPADIWGFGLSLATAAVGKFPIDLPKRGGDPTIFFSLLEKFQDQKMINFPSKYSLDCVQFIESCLALDPGKRPTAAELKAQSIWIQDVSQEEEKLDSKEAARLIMSEIAEAVGQRLVELELRQNFIAVEARQMISKLAEQLNLDEKEVTLELEGAFNHRVTQSNLSDTLNSRDSRVSDSALSFKKGERTHETQLSDTMNSLMSAPLLKTPTVASSVSSNETANRDDNSQRDLTGASNNEQRISEHHKEDEKDEGDNLEGLILV